MVFHRPYQALKLWYLIPITNTGMRRENGRAWGWFEVLLWGQWGSMLHLLSAAFGRNLVGAGQDLVFIMCCVEFVLHHLQRSAHSSEKQDCTGGFQACKSLVQTEFPLLNRFLCVEFASGLLQWGHKTSTIFPHCCETLKKKDRGDITSLHHALNVITADHPSRGTSHLPSPALTSCRNWEAQTEIRHAHHQSSEVLSSHTEKEPFWGLPAQSCVLGHHSCPRGCSAHCELLAWLSHLTVGCTAQINTGHIFAFYLF